jgi:hypothetical protein
MKLTRWRRAVRAGRAPLAASTAAVVVLSLLAEAPTAAVADPAGKPATTRDGPALAQLSPTDEAVMAAQEPYMALDEQVRQVAAAQASSPLAGTRVDVAGRALHVHWVGLVPAELKSIQASAAQRGISVQIVPARFSEQALIAATADLVKLADSANGDISVTIHNDGSGLTVRQDGLPAAAEGRSAPTPLQTELLGVIDATQARFGVPVSLAEGDTGWQTTDRVNDGSPYWGGAQTEIFGGAPGQESWHGCTDAFSMYATGDPSARFMLTAAHCAGYQDDAPSYNGDRTSFMGYTDFIHELYDVFPPYDLGVIRLNPDRSNQPVIYGNNTGAIAHTVRGMASGIPAGGRYCISAAVSTPHCNMVSGDQTWACPKNAPRCWLVIVLQSVDGSVTNCHGDSGGPIYYWTSNGIIAAGVQSVGYFTHEEDLCSPTSGVSVVASAVSRIPGLAVLTP